VNAVCRRPWLVTAAGQERIQGLSPPGHSENRITKMEPTWELRDYDQAFFERELASFVPDRIFDSHAHLYKTTHWRPPRPFIEKGPSVVTLEEFRRQMQWITPGRVTSGLFFGGGLNEEAFEASNRFVAPEVAKDRNSRAQLIVSPSQDPEQVRETVRKGVIKNGSHFTLLVARFLTNNPPSFG
jgi:hypothetical protein